MPRFTFQANAAWDLSNTCAGAKKPEIQKCLLIYPSGQDQDVTKEAKRAFSAKLAFDPKQDGLLLEDKLKVPFHLQGRIPQAPVRIVLDVECTASATQQNFVPPGEEGAVFVRAPKNSSSQTAFVLVVVGFLVAGLGGVFYCVQGQPYVYMTGMFLFILGAAVLVIGLWATAAVY